MYPTTIEQNRELLSTPRTWRTSLRVDSSANALTQLAAVAANSTDTALNTRAGDSATPYGVDLRRLPWIRKLAADYVHNFPALAPFYAGNPADEHAWSDAIARTQSHPRQSQEIAAIVEAQQHERGAPAGAMEAARRLGNPQTVAIVTGQQAGLFGGPVFTLLKATTALKLADRISREHGVDAVAVFWIDAEDHDWDEVRSCTVFDETLTPRRVQLPPRNGTAPGPVGAVRLDGSVSGAIDELQGLLAPTEFRQELVADLRSIYRPGTGMSEGFGRWIERVLGNRGLVVFDSADPAAKPLVGTVFAHELSAPGRTAALAAQAGAGLVIRGYHSQVQTQNDSIALFHLDGARRALRKDGSRVLVGDFAYDASALMHEARERPSAFSPNVLLRPIVQDTLFPTIAYVAGPNELAYLGQLRAVYEDFGVPMPLMYPRATATLVDSAALRFLNKYGVSLEALQPQDEAALNSLLEAQIPPLVEQSFEEAANTLEQQMTRLIDLLPSLDPTLAGAARSTLGKMQHDLESLHSKIIQAAKRRDETLRRQYMRTRALAFPDGHPQERSIGFISFLNQYGPALVDRLFDSLPLDPGCHWVIAV